MDLGEVNHILGLRVIKKEGQISSDQEHYIKNILKKFGMDESTLVTTPMEIHVKLKPLEEYEEVVDAERYRSAVGALNIL